MMFLMMMVIVMMTMMMMVMIVTMMMIMAMMMICCRFCSPTPHDKIKVRCELYSYDHIPTTLMYLHLCYFIIYDMMIWYMIWCDVMYYMKNDGMVIWRYDIYCLKNDGMVIWRYDVWSDCRYLPVKWQWTSSTPTTISGGASSPTHCPNPLSLAVLYYSWWVGSTVNVL